MAFRELFAHYQNKLYSVALRVTRSSTLSEEIVEDVFLKIWLKRNDLLEIQNFSAYLFVITRNRVYKTLKQIAKNYQTVVLAEDNKIAANENIEDYLINKEYSTVLHEAVTRLPQKQSPRSLTRVGRLQTAPGLMGEVAGPVLLVLADRVWLAPQPI